MQSINHQLFPIMKFSINSAQKRKDGNENVPKHAFQLINDNFVNKLHKLLEINF